MYQFSSRIRYSETDGTGNLSVTGLVNYLQDCATFHSNDVGLTVERLHRERTVWVLSNWQIEIARMPHFGEQVRVRTYPHQVRGFLGHRDFLLESEAGERLAAARSLWNVVDPETGKLTRLAADLGAKYGSDEPIDMTPMERRIALPEERFGTFSPVPVAPHMLDDNGHMNNSQYVLLAADCLPQDLPVRFLRAEYKLPTYRGDTLVPLGYRDEQRIVIALTDGQGKTHAVVEFS